MKRLLTFAIALTIAGSAYAACGIKVPVNGKLASYNKEKKELKVGEQAITLEATAKIIGADGKEAKIEDLVGKEVTVSTDKHTKKGESVTAKKAS
jgi:ribosomal protein L18E